MAESFGRRLTAARTRKGWTQEELAEKSGVSRGRISQLETNEVDQPRRKTIIKLAAALAISENELEGIPARKSPLLVAGPDTGSPDLLEQLEQLKRELARERAWTEKLWQENQQLRALHGMGKLPSSADAADFTDRPSIMWVAAA